MKLMEYLPDYYKENETMESLQGILSEQMNGLESSLSTTMNECFINTASGLLSRYEKLYGLEVDVTKSDAFRRERIRAKVRGTGTVTKEMIAQTAKSYSNGEVEVIENNPNSSFVVKFVGTKGIPANMAGLTLTIDEIKPAHLSFTFEYTYNTWNDVKSMTWEEAGEYTWEELRVR